jgi:repressor LexA
MSDKTQIMTDKDKEMYNIIMLYIAQNGYSPTVRELCKISGLRSTSTVHNRLKKLESLGKIQKLTECPRTITVM